MMLELKDSSDSFKAFYLNQNNGRKLEWRMDQGQAYIQVAFSKAVKRTLVCSTFQMMICLVFNTTKMATFKDILTFTGISAKDISNHLLSLCHPKVAVLCKRPNNRELAPDHKFIINPKYNNNLMSVNIPLMKATNAPENVEE